MTIPETIAVTSPAAAVAPEATPNASASGRLTAPTLMGLGGVVAAQALAERLAAGGRRILPSIEASSQTIFMLSWFPQVGAHFILGRMLGAGYWVVAAAMFLAGLLLPLGVAAWVRRKGFQWRWVIGQ